MCIYCGTNKYRKIYENHHGLIPKDEKGRSFEIHHIDGNHSNNGPNNLTCLSLQEHYDLHYEQGDWGACFKMAKRMELSPEEKSVLASKAALKRVNNGSHHFLSGNIQRQTQLKAVAQRKHRFQDKEWRKRHDRIANGTHHFLNGKWQSDNSKKRVNAGTHHFLDKEAARTRANNQIKSGTHPSQLLKICEYCDQTVKSHIYGRWHGPNCRMHPHNQQYPHQ